ncbi:NAD(P)/FAD-dependent oxidoreductase [Nocardioides kongjuensis]|uniref:Glycine/D-amino acid oxidase-like deaminating enzyme n=1 Tax=Nocardioides kongjuensis TaxID=349522 RepID=A0A852RPL1_9ACTN|nr:FAD-dependent oxidoreductase [Nocardioides kongjuensis]NYD32508.1 glycine/D-amino acid oxidase-like deaminating enzyme [Nocardioides kongjuensis]
MTNLTKHRSFWLQEAGVDDVCPPLTGNRKTDVAIVGGGYVGLWTALRIKELDPAVDVTIVEADVCGGGASGRNGGFVLSWWPKFASLTALCGEQEALRLALASEDAITEIGEFCAAHSPEAEFRRSGWLWTATSPAHDRSWDDVVTLADRAKEGTFEHLAPREVARLAGSPTHLAGVLEHSAAIVHPGHLVRALRRRALELGVNIYENTKVKRLNRRGAPRLATAAGTICADRVVVATNAWAAGLKELHTRLFVISSDIVATEEIPNELDEIGWREGPAITDSQTLVCYYRTTDSGRVVFGKGGWSIGIGGHMTKAMERSAGRAEMVTRDFQRYYPMLRQARITHDWAGPIDRTHNSLPIIDWLNREKTIAVGVGWSGNGVGPSVVGGKMLASMVLGRQDEWSSAGLVSARAKHFPPDPVRYVGAHLVREAIVRKERAEALDLRPSRVAVAISNLAPSGLEDKS